MRSVKVFISLILLISYVYSQDFKGKQHGISLDTDAMMQLFDQEPDLQKMADFFFKMNYNEILKKVKNKGLDAETEETTMFISHKKMRADMVQDGQKLSYIMNFENNMMYTIMWDKKEYMEINIDQMQQMQKQAMSQMSQQMESMKGMMDQLPPEAKAAMEKMYGQKKQSPPQVTETGKTAVINGFKCKEYIIKMDDKISQYWITTEYKDLRKTFEEFAKAMPEMQNEDQAIWNEIKEGWPASDAEISFNTMGMGGSYSINEVYSIEKASHPADTFIPPAGFKKKSMQEMMMDGM
ncbi:MAG: DUF4412 domain-containing protein [Calditrichae bacterium]|nr:DUF4412 domain-containing protein [Calditrichota bacterium]MCB9057551.1 DUF4412 domain-containing protein [Calditrichia bacterium]